MDLGVFFTSLIGAICGMIIWHFIKVGKFREHREQFDEFKDSLNREISEIKDKLTKILLYQSKCSKEEKEE